MQLAFPLRLRARTIIVITTALTLVFSTLAAPARAGDDVESARAAALETVNYKINSLEECRAGAKTDHAWAIYSEGIEELGAIKNRILEEDNAEEIYALKSQAKAVWAETKEAAAAADAEYEEGGDEEEDDKAAEEEEQRLREEEEKRRREREKAKAELEEARNRTLSLIEKKVRLLRAASQSAHHDQIADIYREAAGAVAELLDEAREADSIGELEEIAGAMREIVHEAKKEIAEYRPGHDKDADGEDDDGEYDDGEYDDDEFGDKRKRRDDRDGEEDEPEGTEEEETDGTEDEGTSEVDDGAEEQQTILIALNAMELEVDNYQIAIQNTMNGDLVGFPEGPIALAAGNDLLDAIDAARLLTGDELALAWADVMNLHSAYIQLVMEYDRAWQVGLFSAEVAPK